MGSFTYPQRKALLEERKTLMDSKVAGMNRALDMLKIKGRCYEQAAEYGIEVRVKALTSDNPPEEIKEGVRTNSWTHFCVRLGVHMYNRKDKAVVFDLWFEGPLRDVGG